MKTIWKYPFTVRGVVECQMPQGAAVLSVQMQHNQPTMWAVVNDENPLVQRRFRIYGTGHEIDRYDTCTEFVGTFQMAGGDLVFHMFCEPQSQR